MNFKQATTHDFLIGNRECNTQRGSIDSLYIALGNYPQLRNEYDIFLLCFLNPKSGQFTTKNVKFMVSRFQDIAKVIIPSAIK